ncbi:hypothetical protein F66182_10172 [Fusarium sp. NRRL 66182]|nr:hypothetical protein F66182_10172 [Fusarium sp. NRRL 66182]
MAEQSISRVESRMVRKPNAQFYRILTRAVVKSPRTAGRQAGQSDQQSGSMQQTTPCSPSGTDNRTPSFSSAVPLQPPSSSVSMPSDLVTQAIEFYFQHIHRQPLWLFDKNSLPPPDTRQDLMHSIMALRATYHAVSPEDDNLQGPSFYSKAARRGVMLKVAEGNMTIQSTQTLCLLAYLSLISGDTAMAGFDIALAKNMAQLLPDSDQTATNSSAPQEKSKLVWSIHLLSLTCGAPTLVPSIPEDIGTPRLMTTETRDPFMACIPAPQAAKEGLNETLVNVWSQSLKICSLWGGIRLYVAKCIEGLAKYPWHPDSDYTSLCSQLLEVEMAHPNSLSYNSVSFPSILPLDAQTDRLDWLPWLRAQVTYHAIHCVLNHPSLYIAMAKAPRGRLGANTFWRSSYEKALRHSTWISRLIRTAKEKGLQLADPFFAQAAAIATTKTSLIWVLLDVAAPQFPNYASHNSQDGSISGGHGHAFTEVDHAMPSSEMNSPPTDMRESTAHYASPPTWVLARGGTGSHEGTVAHEEDEAYSAGHGIASDHLTAHDLAWGPWENLGPMGDNFCLNMDWWDINQF